MADTYTELNVGVGGVSMDESAIVYDTEPTQRHRTRVVLGSDTEAAGLAKIRNTKAQPTDYALVVRPIPFNTTTPGEPVASYGQVALVPADTETTIHSFICPTDKIFYTVGFSATGNMDARFKLYINDVLALVGRSSSPVPNVQMNLMGINMPVSEGQIVSIKVEHKNDGLQGDYEATILGYTIPEAITQ